MDLSIVIPVHDDTGVERCVQSIDENVDVIIVMNNPTQDISEIVRRLGTKSFTIKQQNLGICYNAGMDASTYNLVLFMDTDCVFTPQAIRKMYQAKKKNPDTVVRGYIEFQSDTLQTRITKSSREVTTANVPYAFIPPLLLDKNVFKAIGDGYRFAEDVGWCVDYEFELRRSKAQIPLIQVRDAVIIHDPITIVADLRSAFRYGRGKRIRHQRTGERVNFIEVLKDPILRGFREKGLTTGVYLALWKSVLYSGYYAQKYGLVK